MSHLTDMHLYYFNIYKISSSVSKISYSDYSSPLDVDQQNDTSLHYEKFTYCWEVVDQGGVK